jgi:hypothetical protein
MDVEVEEPLVPPIRKGYRWESRQPLAALLFILPILLLFHLGAMFSEPGLLAVRDIRNIVGYFGVTAAYLPALLVAGVLLVLHAAGKFPWRISIYTLAGMAGESVLWTVPLIGINELTGKLVAQAGLAAQMSGTSGKTPSLFYLLLQGCGAGIYEEFLFRLVFIGMVILFLHEVFGLKKDLVAVGAIVIGAVLFSLYHFHILGFEGGYPFGWDRFAFLAAAGGYLGVLFMTRGFGLAVGTHVLWNVFAVASNWWHTTT